MLRRMRDYPGAMSDAIKVWGAPEGWDAFLLAQRRREHAGSILHVTRDDARMARLAEALAFVMPEAEVLRFPAWDCLPYDRVSPNPALVSERIATLARLLEQPTGPRIVLTTVNALVQRVPPRSVFAGASMELAVNRRREAGKAGGIPGSQRLWPRRHGDGAGRVCDPRRHHRHLPIRREPDPVRLDLFGDTIESIRVFDPAVPSAAPASARALTLRPVSEVPLGKESIARFRTAWRDLFGQDAAKDPLYLSISDGRRHPGMEHWVPLFHPTMENLLDYLPDAAVSLDHQSERGAGSPAGDDRRPRAGPQSRAPRRRGAVSAAAARRCCISDREGWDEMLAFGPLLAFTPFAMPDGAGGVDGGGRPGSDLRAVQRLGRRWSGDHRVRPVARPGGALERRRAPDRGRRLDPRLARAPDQPAARARVQGRGSGRRLRRHIRRKPAGSISLVVLGVERGFVAERIALVGEQDLLGERISRPPRRRKRADQFIAEATEIAEGDLVVHQEYGIGRYDGLATLHVTGAPHDCLRLIYDGDEKLFLPVENIEVLSRYGSEHQGTALDKLGGAGWQTRKAKMKQRIRDMAGELIRIAAVRKMRDAETMAPPEGTWDEFCARFPFAETEDQSRAISDVLEDLAAGKPMDRLICGDVGFGKTEVALRAAFVAAMSGSQVAVVVPTTLLARQHYRTFSARFAGLPIKVAQLSRMVTAKEANEVRKGVASGDVGIVVGTHALLAKSVEFSDLGLLIVDEEQHFGVAHKERLKAMKADVHVLTLTATPIPRTLQLALTGVREMSIIATPPVDRLAVRTFIMPFDSVVIREALQRERFRGGQVFCVVPRIEDLQRMSDRLREIVPEARTIQAHGRLAPTELERVMTEFGDGKYDILLSTNIVESGLDMPAVNTLVIYRADMFGLGQLYQLRGRVGRGKQRGYAYLTWPPNHRLSVAAEKRLTVMQTLDALGAGFTLASHDLDIRGAGNLLGDEQSGHIKEVGIELYQQMLEDAVADIRVGEGKRAGQERDWTPNISLGLPVLIPEAYVRDLPVRLGLYRRIGALASDGESDAMAAELVDRFGTLPEEVENLLGVVALKRACRGAGVEKLEAGPKGMVLSFRGNAFSNPAGLVRWLSSKGGLVRLRPDHKLAISRDMDVATRLKFARDTLKSLDEIVRQAKAA